MVTLENCGVFQKDHGKNYPIQGRHPVTNLHSLTTKKEIGLYCLEAPEQTTNFFPTLGNGMEKHGQKSMLQGHLKETIRLEDMIRKAKPSLSKEGSIALDFSWIHGHLTAVNGLSSPKLARQERV